MPRWIEVTLHVDGEAAEATAEILQRYGYQGVAVEHEGIPPDKLDEDEIPPAKQLGGARLHPRRRASRGHQSQARKRARLHEHDVPHAHARLRDRRGKGLGGSVESPLSSRAHRQAAADPPAVDGDRASAGRRGDRARSGHGVRHGHAPDDAALPRSDRRRCSCPARRCSTSARGSGILSIAAAKLGAGHVLALDIDPIAVEAAQANAEQNGVGDGITVQEGSLERWSARRGAST